MLKANILSVAMVVPPLFCTYVQPAIASEKIKDSSTASELLWVKESTDSKGKLLTADEVSSGRCFRPSRSKGFFEELNANAGFGRKQRKLPAPQPFENEGSLYLSWGSDTVSIARGGDGISYGTSVSRNEFGINGGIFVSPDSMRIAFYRKDETAVKTLPYLDITRPGGACVPVRYPMNSEPSEKISVGCYDIESGKTVYMDVSGEFDDERYLTNVCWNPDCRTLYIQILSRDQRHLRLNSYDSGSGRRTAIVLEEESSTWVEPKYPLHFVKGSREQCIYTTDNRDGWQNLYLVNVRKKTVERLACVDRFMEYVGNDGSAVYFQGPDGRPVNNYLWKCTLDSRRITCLTPSEGWHTIEMSDDCSRFTDVYEALGKAPESSLMTTDGRLVKTLDKSDDPTLEYACGEISIGTVPTADGSDLNYFRMVKPVGFDPAKKYPLVFYVYGGPGLSLVRNNFLGGLRMWEMYMAQKGFVVFAMDNRGTPRHSSAYAHCIFGQCGQKESEDQLKAVEMLRELPWIDNDRIGIYGWSYGGFMSLTLSTAKPDMFKATVAGGPVIDWRWYEIMYGERFMGRCSENPERFEATSLIPKAKELKGRRTLIIEGGMDDVVVPLHALSFIQAAVDAGVQIDYFTYPKAGHNMRDNDRANLVDKVADFFLSGL